MLVVNKYELLYRNLNVKAKRNVSIAIVGFIFLVLLAINLTLVLDNALATTEVPTEEKLG